MILAFTPAKYQPQQSAWRSSLHRVGSVESSSVTHSALCLAAVARLRLLFPKYTPLKLCQALFSSPRLLQYHLLDRSPLGYGAAIPLRCPKPSSSKGHSLCRVLLIADYHLRLASTDPRQAGPGSGDLTTNKHNHPGRFVFLPE